MNNTCNHQLTFIDFFILYVIALFSHILPPSLPNLPLSHAPPHLPAPSLHTNWSVCRAVQLNQFVFWMQI